MLPDDVATCLTGRPISDPPAAAAAAAALGYLPYIVEGPTEASLN